MLRIGNRVRDLAVALHLHLTAGDSALYFFCIMAACLMHLQASPLFVSRVKITLVHGSKSLQFKYAVIAKLSVQTHVELGKWSSLS